MLNLLLLGNFGFHPRTNNGHTCWRDQFPGIPEASSFASSLIPLRNPGGIIFRKLPYSPPKGATQQDSDDWSFAVEFDVELRNTGQSPAINANAIAPSSTFTDVLQLSGRLAGDVKELRNGNPTRDLQMAADRTRPHTL